MIFILRLLLISFFYIAQIRMKKYVSSCRLVNNHGYITEYSQNRHKKPQPDNVSQPQTAQQLKMTTDFSVYIVTWNVGECKPPEDLTRLLRLDSKKLPGIYAIGLQELDSAWSHMAKDSVYDDPWTNKISDTLHKKGYVKLKCLRLIGIHESVYIQRQYLPNVTNVESEYTRTGFRGLWGNKGGMSIRVQIFGVNVCFVNCHFQAHRYNYLERLQDYDDMLESQSFRDPDTPTILDHDYVFWFGDLNFRIDELPREEVIKRIKMKDYDYLLGYDQLLNAMKEEKILVDFEEGTINFDPTYKYDYGTNDYDTSKKQRIPSWCDRVLSKVSKDSFDGLSLNAQQVFYTDVPFYTDSDHKPVISEFIIKVLKYPQSLPVQFLPVDGWKVRKDSLFRYTISPNRFSISIWDWIGLYRANFRHVYDYASYIYAPQVGQALSDSTTIYKAEFEDHKLGVQPGLYCLGYFSYRQNCVIGWSDTFMIDSKDGATSAYDLSETSSASSGNSD